MNQTIQQQVVSECLNKEVSHKEALEVIENDFSGIVVFLGLRKRMQIEAKTNSFTNYSEYDKRKVITLYKVNGKTIAEISEFLFISKVIVKQILVDYTGKKLTAASKN